MRYFQDMRGEPKQVALHTFLSELGRAQRRFDGLYVGLTYFLTRWRSRHLTPDVQERTRIFQELVDAGHVEVYTTATAERAIRRKSA